MRIAFMGDVVPGGIFYDQLQNNGFRLFPYEFQMLLNQFDMRVCNLECPLYDETEPKGRKTVLRSPTESIKAIKKAGINLVSLANNHVFDYGIEGFQSTISTLRQHGIGFVGAGMSLNEARNPHIVSDQEMKIGFLAYSTHDLPYMKGSPPATQNSPGIAPMNWRLMREDIIQLKAGCDYIVLLLHWGRENTSFPPIENLRIAKKLLQLGVDLIVGSHSHCIQGRFSQSRRHTFFSLGNLLFPNYYQANPYVMVYPNKMEQISNELRIFSWNTRNRISMLLDVKFHRKSYTFRYVPTYQTDLSNKIFLLKGLRRILVRQWVDILSYLYCIANYPRIYRILTLIDIFAWTFFETLYQGQLRLAIFKLIKSIYSRIKIYGRGSSEKE